MLRSILNISRKDYPTKIRLYGNIQPLTSTLRIRRIGFAGHCYRSEEEIIKDVLLRMPNLKKAMKDRTTWKKIVEISRETIQIR